jgi:hypothetical protein
MLQPISLGSLEVISRLLRHPDFLPSSDSRRLLTVILLALESLSLDKLQTPRFQAVKLKILHALCENGEIRPISYLIKDSSARLCRLVSPTDPGSCSYSIIRHYSTQRLHVPGSDEPTDSDDDGLRRFT